MIVKERQYLGNTNTLEVHDTDQEHENCQLGEIRPEHRVWYHTLEAAKQDRPYDNSHWCLGGSKR